MCFFNKKKLDKFGKIKTKKKEEGK